MTTQLLLRYDSFDRAAHDAEAEDRADAGLTQLQLWREDTGAHWALFEVAARGASPTVTLLAVEIDEEAAIVEP